MTTRELRMRRRVAGEDGVDRTEIFLRTDWAPGKSAVIIGDMWDAHHCHSAARRVVEMAPHLNRVVSALRALGALVVHAPSGCMDFYDDVPARRRALDAPHEDAPADFDWNRWDQTREAELPPWMADPGPCSCETPEPCCDVDPSYPWTRQIESIEIDPTDAISDDGQEIFNLISQGGIDDVVVMGVHTNICVLRP